MSNPAGVNQADRFGTQQYGSIKRMTQLSKEAPMSGAPMANASLGAPRKAQRTAIKGPSRAASAPAPMPLTPQTAPPTMLPPPSGGGPHSLYIAQVWNDIASVPGASPLVQELAQRAQRQVGQGG